METLSLNAVFYLLAHLLALPMLYISVNSPNLVHQYYKGEKIINCPSNFGVRLYSSLIISTGSFASEIINPFLYLREAIVRVSLFDSL